MSRSRSSSTMSTRCARRRSPAALPNRRPRPSNPTRAADPQARCGVEALVRTNRLVLAGETRGPASITPDRLIDVARRAIRDIGYDQENFHWERAAVDCYIHNQSSDIAQGVDASGNKD